MKNRKKYLVISFLVICYISIITTACKKKEDDDAENNTPVLTDKLTASFDGVGFTSTSVLRQTAGSSISVMGKKDPQTLFVLFPDTCKVGTYQLNAHYSECYLTYYPTADATLAYASSSGTITFSEFSATGKIKATFNGIVTKLQKGKSTTISVTNGVLEVN